MGLGLPIPGQQRTVTPPGEVCMAAVLPARDAKDRWDSRRTAPCLQGKRRAGMGAAPSLSGCCAGPLSHR